MLIVPDEKIDQTFELNNHDGYKMDSWNGYDPATYARVVETLEARDNARRKLDILGEDVDSAYKNPMPMHEDPLPDMDPNENSKSSN
ncbi:OLC1v1007027C1 [Oldenlandia corymbosa var. corymbosa]|uniref:OLC1v1007027C1 n=1 Tax=Oldenlandia corymbosa var. corymbosa TaxID=529605 RepID=A0AAV1DIF8_OLDCO|nr:OLC1v1007027C1 [Oldenlandia corymbosa var. corymbosa]